MRSSEPSYCRELNAPLLVVGIAHALDVEHAQAALAVERDGRGEPAGGNRARHLPPLARRGQHRDGVVAAAGHVERFAVGREGQRDRLAAEGRIRVAGNLDVRARQSSWRPAGRRNRSGCWPPPASFVRAEGQVRGRQAHRHLAHGERLGIHHAEGARGGRAGHRVGRRSASRSRALWYRPARRAARRGWSRKSSRARAIPPR